MDIEARLRALESRYRQAANAAVAAKAHYLAILDEGGANAAAIRRARQHWLNWDERKRAVAARMGELEDYETRLTL
jgi:hypothetical protein